LSTAGSGAKIPTGIDPNRPVAFRLRDVIDMSDPTKPQLAGRWWIPGMWRAGGETPTWRTGRR
jgi:hypothetical protein